MAKEKRSPEALALLYLRNERGWSQKDLAAALGLADEKLLSRYETDGRRLRRENLDSLVAPLGHSPEAVDALLFVHSLVSPPPLEEAASPVALTPEERGEIDRTVLTAGWTLAAELRAELVRRKKRQKTDAALRKAEELLDSLKSATRHERRDLVAVFPQLRSWAVAVKLCEASVRAASHRVEDALELAELALFVAERMAGEESWRCRLQGWCWAHVANARRVATDFVGADEALVRAWRLWRSGAASDPELLPECRLLDLEASLRREQHRFPQALKLLDQALALSNSEPTTSARILLKKEHVFDQMGDTQGALAVLVKAAPFVEASGDPHLLFALRFKTVNNLCQLKRYEEAARLVSAVRELAMEQGNEMNLLRVVWLQARISAGLSRAEEAMAGLEQVRLYFTACELPYEAALSSLELAALWLEAGRIGEVRDVAVAMAWIFKSTGIQREALAALQLFRDAAEREVATVELTRRVIAEIKKVKTSASPPENGTRGRS